MPGEQFGLQRVGMIEVDLAPLLGRQAFEIAIVGIVRDPLDPIAPHAVVDRLGHRRLSRPRAAGDPDDDRRFHAPLYSSSSASVMKSVGSSLPQVLQMTVTSFSFEYSNWYVGV